MKYINKLKNFSIPFDYPKFAIVISIAAFGFAASTHDTPCLSAQSTCSVGSDNEFTGNISLKGGTPNLATFDASGITADRTLTIPNNTGTLALTSDITPPSYTPDAPFLKVDGTGTAVVGSLTASTPLKSSASGQIAASDLDITTDITPGTALQEIRVNAGATALEYFTPSGGGGRWSEVASGSITTGLIGQPANSEVACFGVSLDPSKTYKFTFDGGDSSTYGSSSAYFTYYTPLTSNCATTYTSYTTNKFTVGLASMGNLSNTTQANGNEDYCYMTGAWPSSGFSPMFYSGVIEFYGTNSTSNTEGFSARQDIGGLLNNGAGSVTGAQVADGQCHEKADYNAGIDFTTITGFGMVIEKIANGSRTWVLWESTN
tara:strand:+ start:5674 stop:6798 length:1125 start_codon:yes stop_codon:yes gene_type:complete